MIYWAVLDHILAIHKDCNSTHDVVNINYKMILHVTWGGGL